MSPFSSSNKDCKYLLTVIDVYSKYGWIMPLKTKTGKEVAQAFRKLFHTGHPSRLWTDKGTEFYSRQLRGALEANDVMLYPTENEEKSSVVERWNKTMRNIMWKCFTANRTQKYIDVLPSMVDKYNSTYHRSIKLTCRYRYILTVGHVPVEKVVKEEDSGRDGDSQDIETAPVGSLPTSSPKVQGELSSFVEPPSAAHTRSYGKAKRVRGAFYKGFSKGEGVVYLSVDINGLAKKLQLLAAEFFTGNTTVRNELVHVLDAWYRLKQLTRKEYTNIIARLAA